MVESVKHRTPPPQKKTKYHTFYPSADLFRCTKTISTFFPFPGKENKYSKVHVVVLIRAGKLSEPNLLAKLLVIFHQVLHLSCSPLSSSNPAGIPFLNGKSFFCGFFLDRIRTFHGFRKNHDIFLHIFLPSSEPSSFGWVGKYHHRFPTISLGNFRPNLHGKYVFSTQSLRGWAVTTSWPWLFLLFSFEWFFWDVSEHKNFRRLWLLLRSIVPSTPKQNTSSYLLGGIFFDSNSWPRYFCRSKKVPARIHGKLEH